MMEVEGQVPEIQSEVSEPKSYDEAYVKGLRVKLREMEGQVMRSGIAARYGLPDDLREFLTASDEAGIVAQAEKLAAQIKPVTALPPAGGRNPANAEERHAKADERDHFEGLRRRVPALMNRVFRS